MRPRAHEQDRDHLCHRRLLRGVRRGRLRGPDRRPGVVGVHQAVAAPGGHLPVSVRPCGALGDRGRAGPPRGPALGSRVLTAPGAASLRPRSLACGSRPRGVGFGRFACEATPVARQNGRPYPSAALMEGSVHPLPARPATSSASANPGSFDELCTALEQGAGIPEVLRAAARALEASLVLIDPSSSVLAVATRSPTEERSLMTRAAGVEATELRIAGDVVGQLRLRSHTRAPVPADRLLVVRALLAGELARVRAPERVSEEASASFVRAVLRREVTDRGDLVARGKELGIDLERGASVLVARGHPLATHEGDWRRRMLAIAERAGRATAPGALAALVARAGRVLGVGRSRVAADPVDLHRAAH